MTREVLYRDHAFGADVERTRDVYSSDDRPVGAPELCGCDRCKNFVAIREKFYPAEFKELLAHLGVDYHRESEVYHIARYENGSHNYGGWFHFKGSILRSTNETIELNKDFLVWFSKKADLHLFRQDELQDLVQVEFSGLGRWELPDVPELD